MTKNITGLFALLFCMLQTVAVHAQTGAPDWLEDSLYGSGKLNTVTAVVGIILLGIAIWLFSLDRKLKKLEDKMNRPIN